MTYRRVALRCRCGHRAGRINDFGLTADHRLVVRWWCTRCKRVVYVFKSLADCWRDCPRSEMPEVVAQVALCQPAGQGDSPALWAGQSEFGPEDVKFLHSLGVTFSADEE